MPWKELSKMDERMRFVARLMEGEKMAALCREFDISRKPRPSKLSVLRFQFDAEATPSQSEMRRYRCIPRGERHFA
jgi:hypothetical protein